LCGFTVSYTVLHAEHLKQKKSVIKNHVKVTQAAWLRSMDPGATTNSSVSALRYTGVYPHEPNVISEAAIAARFFPVHPEEQRLSTAVLSSPQHSTDITRVSL
jgi:hypothetical protein